MASPVQTCHFDFDLFKYLERLCLGLAENQFFLRQIPNPSTPIASMIRTLGSGTTGSTVIDAPFF